MATKFKLTIIKPRTAIEGWTGHLTNPRTGERHRLVKYSGGGLVSFSSKEALVQEARRMARGLS